MFLCGEKLLFFVCFLFFLNSSYPFFLYILTYMCISQLNLWNWFDEILFSEKIKKKKKKSAKLDDMKEKLLTNRLQTWDLQYIPDLFLFLFFFLFLFCGSVVFSTLILFIYIFEWFEMILLCCKHFLMLFTYFLDKTLSRFIEVSEKNKRFMKWS